MKPLLLALLATAVTMAAPVAAHAIDLTGTLTVRPNAARDG